MFLALKELKKEKLRSGLMIAMIVLISYLIFILTSLALGLARENTAAINQWGAQRIALNSTANTDLRQSFLTQQQVGKLSQKEALIGETSVVAKASGHKQLSATFIGLKSHQFIAQNLKIESGRQARHAYEVVADDSLKRAGYHLNSQLKLNDTAQKFTIVGFTKNAKLNISPIIYGQLTTWQSLRNLTNGPVGSAIVSQNNHYQTTQKGVKVYSKQQVINKLPGYTAQNMTFMLMIGFLMVISLIIIAVFLYILTMQKLPNYAVLRVQGIPSKVLVGATISQSVLLVLSGLAIGALLTAITAIMMPAAVPMAFDLTILGAVGVGLLIMALLGGLIPVRSVLNVDPISVIGG